MQHTNRTVSVDTLALSGEKRVFSRIITALPAYINQTGEQVEGGFDGEASFFFHRMMTSANHAAISIGDRVTDDKGKAYDVKGASVFDDFTGKHGQYLLAEAID
jgi:hypothetical protein